MSKTLRLTLLSLFLLATAIAPALTLAQDGGLIVYGQVVTGQITSDVYEVRYTFQGTAGDTILISMSALDESTTGPRLDSYLELLGINGESLYTDDDSGGNLNSLLGPVTLQETGVYTVIATRFQRASGTSTGQFELVVNQAQLTPVALDTPVTATLNDEQPRAFFTYSSSGSEVLALSGSSQGDSAYTINVRTTAGGYLNSSYMPVGSPPLLDPLYLSEAGSYVIVVNREPTYDNQGNLLPAQPVTVTFSLTAIQAQPIAFDTPVSAILSDENPSDHYMFSGATTDLLSLAGSVSADDQDIEVLIYSPQGISITGGSTAYNAEPDQFTLDPVQLPVNGSYLLVVRRLDVSGAGVAGTVSRYTVTLSQSLTVSLQPGAAVTGTVGPENYEQVYRFEGTAGQVVRFTLRSLNEGYGLTMSINGPSVEASTNSYHFNVNSSTGGAVIYEVTLPATGTYLVRVNNGAFTSSGPLTGDFSLLVEIVQ